jgi:hypothetical protein
MEQANNTFGEKSFKCLTISFFTLQDFHFGVAIQSWKDNTIQYGV